MTPIEAIRTATSNAAELLGMAGQVGSIEKGAYADLVAAPGDPLQDVSTLSKIDFVMMGGEVVRMPAPYDLETIERIGEVRDALDGLS